MSIVSRIRSLLPAVFKAAEGEWRPGPYYLPSGGVLDDSGNGWSWWQRGGYIAGYSPSAVVEACVSAYSQTVAMCPGDHWWLNDDGGRERVTTSALCRILRKPNAYQSISDFLLNGVRDLYMSGNCYALALRNSRAEIEELHLMNPRQCMPRIATTGDVFYSLGGNHIIDYQLVDGFPLLVPARDVLHIRLHTNQGSYYNQLIGQSPLVAATADLAVTDAILSQQVNFYRNQARPSQVLSTDMTLDATQVQQLRDRWDEMSKGLNAGRTPILTAGLKPVAMATNAVDGQLAEVLKMSEQHIAIAFRVPLQILGIGGTPLGSTEALMQLWKASGLGFCLNHIEEAFGNLFALKGQPQEYVEFNTDALLRSSMKERVESFARGVQGGIYAPNEARAEFGLAEVEFGDEPRVQAQVVPLSAATGIESAPSAPAAPAAPALPAPVKDSPDVELTRIAKNYIARANRIDRRRQSSA